MSNEKEKEENISKEETKANENEVVKEATANEKNANEKNAKEKHSKEKHSKEKHFKENPLDEVVADLKDKQLRIIAEYDNYKKRSTKEKLDAYTSAKVDTIQELLPTIDNLERATANPGTSEDAIAILEGVKLVQKQLLDTFTKLGVETIGGVGEQFDPNQHNAVMHIEDENIGENEIVEVFSKGYKIKDKVVRHAMVKVAN